MKYRYFKQKSILMILLVIFFAAMPQNALALENSSIDSIQTNLTDVERQLSSTISFDVIARNAEGKKIDCTVTLNGLEVRPSWNDTSKASFRPKFTEAGENIIAIAAGDAAKTFKINYIPTPEGEVVGEATVTIEAFTLGAGYLVDPINMEIIEGENAAQLLDRVLTENGYTYRNTGTLTQSFYLASITGGRLPIKANMPELLEENLKNLTDIRYEDENEDSLGEFNYTAGSGWMYCVNGVFPNVGFADYTLSDGDVMRVQFTFALGTDLGGASAMGYSYSEDYYKVADKDELTRLIAEKGIENVSEEVLNIATKIDSPQEDVDRAVNILKSGELYNDISGHWAEKSIYFVSERNLFQGTGKGMFSPDDKVTRAMLVTVMHRMADNASSEKVPYEDVPSQHWAADAISWAAANEIAQGTSENAFSPDALITREELTAILYRYAMKSGLADEGKADMNNFSDSKDVSPWASEALSWAVGKEIINGRADNTLDPSGTATRGEIATILQRYMLLGTTK